MSAPALPTGARAAIEAVAEGFSEADADLVSSDPLRWPEYATTRERAHERSGENEAVVCGPVRIEGRAVEIVSFDFRFMGGSMGEAAGRRITRAFERATEARRPVVSLIASGGCRMQEGMRSLVQMQAIAAAAHRHRDAGLAHIGVLRDPVTGGVWAALGAGADLLIAAPEATVAFAGHRVRDAAPDDDDAAFTAEGKLADGQVDMIAAAHELPATLALAVELLGGGEPGGDPAPAEVPAALGASDPPPDGWAAVQRARAPERPHAADYLERHFDARLPISGDRAGGSDPGILCGIGRRGGRAIAYAAQTGTANPPAGYRTAARLVRLADRLGLPLLTLADTPGAANDAAAERAGVGAAINDLFAAVAGVRVPVTTLVVGEGGSGGALALSSPSRLWIAPDAYFAVIVPEAATSILKRDPSEAPQTAERLRLRPQDLLELGIVHGIAGAEPVAT